jgi:hypothetical protein
MTSIRLYQPSVASLKCALRSFVDQLFFGLQYLIEERVLVFNFSFSKCMPDLAEITEVSCLRATSLIHDILLEEKGKQYNL